MRIAGYIQDSIVDGPGLRFVLFTQGCPHKCVGCHNPDTHDFGGGRDEAVEKIISEMLSNPLTDGLTLSGGEPFSQSAECAIIADSARRSGLNVWCYTGYTFEELLAGEDKDALCLLMLSDVLVDGSFIQSKRNLKLKWRGSENQRIIDVKKSVASLTPILYDL